MLMVKKGGGIISPNRRTTTGHTALGTKKVMEENASTPRTSYNADLTEQPQPTTQQQSISLSLSLLGLLFSPVFGCCCFGGNFQFVFVAVSFVVERQSQRT